jgi:hypothetical protein
MDIGMLWFDNDPKNDLASKISRAADYYQKKYGQVPDLCFVHPSMLQGDSCKAGRIDIKPNRSVRPNHFWIGVNTFSAKAG